MTSIKEKIFYLESNVNLGLHKGSLIEAAFEQPKLLFKVGYLINQREGDDDISFHGSPWYETISTIELEDGKIIEQGEHSKNKIEFFLAKDLETNAQYYLKQVEKEISKLLLIKENIMNNQEKMKANALNNNLVSEQIDTKPEIKKAEYKVFIGLKWCDVLIEDYSDNYKDMFYEYKIFENKNLIAEGIDKISFDNLEKTYNYFVDEKSNDGVAEVPHKILQNYVKENIDRLMDKPKIEKCSPLLRFMLESCKENEWGGSQLYPGDINKGKWDAWNFSHEDIIELKNEISKFVLDDSIKVNLDLLNSETKIEPLISVDGYAATCFDLKCYSNDNNFLAKHNVTNEKIAEEDVNQIIQRSFRKQGR